MLILGLDTATLACSVALLAGDHLLGEYTLQIQKTHSQRLLPLIDALLRDCGVEREELQAIAVAAGPGSFTGIRIGVATARGLAQGLGIPVVAVPTLSALAEAVSTPGALICPLLDARRNQVYAAIFRRETRPGGGLEEIMAPAALALPDLLAKLDSQKTPVSFLGDGVPVYREEIGAALKEKAVFLPAPLRCNRAGLAALYGSKVLHQQQTSYNEVRPFYLRKPEAERRAKEMNRNKYYSEH